MGKMRSHTQRSLKQRSTISKGEKLAENIPDEAIPSEIEYRLPPFHKGQVAIFALSVFLFVAHLVVIIWPLWALMNEAVTTPTILQIFFFKGLFVQCLQWMPGQFQCDNFLRPVFSLSGYALAQRSLAIFSSRLFFNL